MERVKSYHCIQDLYQYSQNSLSRVNDHRCTANHKHCLHTVQGNCIDFKASDSPCIHRNASERNETCSWSIPYQASPAKRTILQLSRHILINRYVQESQVQNSRQQRPLDNATTTEPTSSCVCSCSTCTIRRITLQTS